MWGERVNTTDVLVIGAGPAGIRAALELAQSGYAVHLVEKEPYIGGLAAQLCCKGVEDCIQCSICLAVRTMTEVTDHPNIALYTHTTVEALSGGARDFTVGLREHTHFVDAARCIACGRCAEVCPVDEGGPAIGLASAHPVPLVYHVDTDTCLRFHGEDCTRCMHACPEDAIRYDRQGVSHEIEVGGIIVATGFEPFNARLKPAYGYGRYPNVCTSVDIERMINERGEIVRPSDGRAPKRIAFIQCVGSRDEQIGLEYCSRICCKYATKVSKLLHNLDPAFDITIFFMDIRTFERQFNEMLELAWKDNINMVRVRPAAIDENEEHNLIIRYYDTEASKPQEAEFDLVSLSIGLVPGAGTKLLARKLDLQRGAEGFLSCRDIANPVKSHRYGIYIAGGCTGPMDIEEAVTQACSAASKVMALLRL